MNMLHFFEWLASGLLLTGTVLLTYKKRAGWLTNFFGSLFMGIAFYQHIPIVALQSIFCTLAIIGFIRWRKVTA